MLPPPVVLFLYCTQNIFCRRFRRKKQSNLEIEKRFFILICSLFSVNNADKAIVIL